jgi:hypothetical protein
VENGQAIDSEALYAAITPCGEPFRHETYRLTARWLRRQVLRTINLRLSNVVRQMTMPAYFTPFARSFLTLVGVLGQLETEGPYRDEIVRWVPELSEAFIPEENTEVIASTVDLGTARRRRAEKSKRGMPIA